MSAGMSTERFSTLAGLTAENVLRVHNSFPDLSCLFIFFNYSRSTNIPSTSNMKKSFESNLLIKGTLRPFISSTSGSNKESFLYALKGKFGEKRAA